MNAEHVQVVCSLIVHELVGPGISYTGLMNVTCLPKLSSVI